jgi:alanyl-tRNA synthetase
MGEQKNPEVITKSKIDKAINLLKEQKPKQREDVSDREAVRKMRRYIEKLTSDKYGYTYDEVAEMLKGLGINLSGSRIKYLIGELRKSSRQRKKSEEQENNQSSEQPTETQPAVKASSEAEKSTVSSAKGKRKSQQPAAQQPEGESDLQGEFNDYAFQPKVYKDEDL